MHTKITFLEKECINSFKKPSFYVLLCSSLLLGIGNAWFHKTWDIVQLSALLAMMGILGIMILGEKRFFLAAGQLLLVSLITVFVFFYFYHQKPELQNNYWWRNLIISIGLCIVLGASVKGLKESFQIFLAFSLGSFIISTFYVLSTLQIQGHLGSGLIDPLDGYVMHRCGIANEMLILPCLLVLYSVTAKKKYSYVSQGSILLIYIFCSYTAFYTQSRFTFLMLYFVIPTIGLLDRFIFTKNPRIRLWIVFIATAFFLMMLFLLRMIPRPINSTLLHDGRWEFLRSFVGQLLSQPLIHSVKPAALEVLYAGGPWFHNFFCDVHRTSGLWAFIAAITLYCYIGWRVFRLCTEKIEARFILYFFIFISIMLVTSVVPEGEFQPLLLLIMIGSVTEALLKESSNSVAS